MNYMHYEYYLNEGNNIRINLDKQANVRLMDDNNFRNYHNGLRYEYYGGLATKSPFLLKVPYAGRWHVVIDLGGYAGTVQSSVQVI